MLGRLAADEGRTRLGAGARDSRDDVGDALGNHAPARDVVGHEQRSRPDHDDVVDDHADQVLADGVVLVEACAIATLVPTPSVEVASSGRRYAFRNETSNSPANPPTPPRTSGPCVFCTADFMSSTARSPAAVSTPASR